MFVHADEYLVEILQQLPEVMQDVEFSEQNIDDFIKHQVEENDIDLASSDGYALCYSIRAIARAVRSEILVHGLVYNRSFPYTYHELLGNSVVFIHVNHVLQL